MRNDFTPKKTKKQLLKRCLALVLAGSVALPLTAPEKMTRKTIHAASENVIYGDVNSDQKNKPAGYDFAEVICQ